MSQDYIYAKTPAGEEAVKQRSVVQRSLRSLLIMIDGQTRIAEIAQRFPDPTLVEGLVLELEQRGLVQCTNPEAASALIDHVEIESILSTDPEEFATPARAPRSTPDYTRSPVIDDFVNSLPDLDVPEVHEGGLMAAVAETSGPDTAASPPGRWRAWLGRMAEARADRPKRSPTQALAARHKMRRWAIALVVCGLAAVPTIAYLYPYQRHVAEIERLAGELLGHRVEVGSMAFSAWPEPHLRLSDVKVGPAAELRVKNIRMVPDWLTVFSERKMFREVVLEHPTIDIGFLSGLPFRGDVSWATRYVKIQSVPIENAHLTLLGGGMGNMAGEILLTDNGALKTLKLHDSTHKLRLEAQADRDGWLMQCSAQGWTIPGNTPLTLDYFEATGRMMRGRMEWRHFEGKLYDGLISGVASMIWGAGQPLRVVASMNLQRLHGRNFLSALAPPPPVEGELSAQLNLRAQTPNLENTISDWSVAGDLVVERGLIAGMDFVQAMRAPSALGVRGGATKFDRLRARIELGPGTVNTSDIELSSGPVSASGAIASQAGEKLSGALNVRLVSSATTVRALVPVGGTRQAPVLGRTPGSP